MLDDDRRPAFDAWLDRKPGGVTAGIRRDAERWLRTLKDGGPRNRPRSIATLIGHLIPLLPFVWLPRTAALVTAIVLSALVLFGVGVYESVTPGRGLAQERSEDGRDRAGRGRDRVPDRPPVSHRRSMTRNNMEKIQLKTAVLGKTVPSSPGRCQRFCAG